MFSCSYEPNVRLIKASSITGDYDRSFLTELASNVHNPQEQDLTWFQIKEKEVIWTDFIIVKILLSKIFLIIKYFVEQDKQYLPIKKSILNGLEEIKGKLKELMSANQKRDDLAKLKEHEFYLDLDELDRLQKETDNEIQNVFEKIFLVSFRLN